MFRWGDFVDCKIHFVGNALERSACGFTSGGNVKTEWSRPFPTNKFQIVPCNAQRRGVKNMSFRAKRGNLQSKTNCAIKSKTGDCRVAGAPRNDIILTLIPHSLQPTKPQVTCREWACPFRVLVLLPVVTLKRNRQACSLRNCFTFVLQRTTQRIKTNVCRAACPQAAADYCGSNEK